MRKLLAFVSALSCCSSLFAYDGATSGTASLHWTTNFEEAQNQSKSTSKPMVLFFTGSDWCGWCHKLEQEVLNTPEFVKMTQDKFIFVLLDFPLYKQTDSKTQDQNKLLQKKYNVKGFPTLVVLDKNGQVIGTSGYRPGGAEAYANYLLKMTTDYSQYKQNVSQAEKKSLSSRDLKKLYEKASELNLSDDANKIVNLGLKSDDKSFFLLERYRLLSQEGLIHNAEAKAIKKEIEHFKSETQVNTQYEIALIEFEAYSDEMNKENYSPDIAVEPLVNYINTYGQEDKENLWKIQMIISQAYLDKNKLFEALEYAQASYETAPQAAKSEIGTAVANLKKELK